MYTSSTTDYDTEVDGEIIVPRFESSTPDFDESSHDRVTIRRKLTIDSLSSLCESESNLEDNLNFEIENPLNTISFKCVKYVKSDDISQDEYNSYFNKKITNVPPCTTTVMRSFSSIQSVDQEFLQPFLDGVTNIKEITVGGAGYSKWFIFRDKNKNLWIVSMSVDSYVCLCGMKCAPGYDDHSRIEFRETSKQALISLLWGVPYNKKRIVVDRELIN